MKSVILLTFGFLGFALYQMSGGAEFVPASESKVTLSGAIVPNEPAVLVAETLPPADKVADPVVTRVALDLTTLQPADKAKAITQEELQEVAALATPDSATETVPSNVNVLESGTTPAIIPSLIVPNDTGTVIQASAPATNNFRMVKGSRVNVRNGPGTDYGVVTKLVKGDTVEILEDSGDGWVRMRPVDGGPSGWMADFLLTSG